EDQPEGQPRDSSHVKGQAIQKNSVSEVILSLRFLAVFKDTYTVHGTILGEAAWILQGHFDSKGEFIGDYSDWEKVAGKLTKLWFGDEAPSPVKTRSTEAPDFHTPGLVHRVVEPSSSDVAEWKRSASCGEASSATPPVVIEPAVTPQGHKTYFEVETPTKIPNPLKKVQLMAEKKLEQQLKRQKKDDAGGPQVPAAAGTTTGSSGKGGKKKIESGKKRKPNNGPMKIAMDKFIAKKRAKGFSYKDSLRLWSTSKQRQAI
ncbi:unnamed protein product, partial [Durusdinium trenchii]